MADDNRRPPVAVVMGVAGCGKTVIGEALAERLGCRFIEGDQLHPPRNVERMASGQPLTDALREGWLDAIGAEMSASVGRREGVVAACSALKRIYRNRLRKSAPDIVFIYPRIDSETARRRVGNRKGHFMPASLVDSQFAALQEPEADERAIVLDGTRSVEDLVASAEMGLRPR